VHLGVGRRDEHEREQREDQAVHEWSSSRLLSLRSIFPQRIDQRSTA
jgi:hypothetical protein